MLDLNELVGPKVFDNNGNVLWQFAEASGMTYFGTSAAFINGCMKAGIHPNQDYDLSKIRGVGSTGSPLAVNGFQWIYENIPFPTKNQLTIIGVRFAPIKAKMKPTGDRNPISKYIKATIPESRRCAAMAWTMKRLRLVTRRSPTARRFPAPNE